MSKVGEINEESQVLNESEIKEFLSPEVCEDAGIIVIDIKDKILNLGAMNLDYIKVKKVINNIEDKFDLKVSLKQITSIEWETWFENTHSVSVESIQKNNIQNEPDKEIFQFNNQNQEKSLEDQSF